MAGAWWAYAINVCPFLELPPLWGLHMAEKLPLSFEAMSSDNSEMTFFFFFLDEDFVFVMVEHLEQYNLLLFANSHVEPGQFLYNRQVRKSCKKFCHWVWITSVLRFIKHIFITNLQSIPPLLKHIFVTFLPSREKQIVFFWYLLETLINSAAKRTSRCILISRKHFLKPWK